MPTVPGSQSHHPPDQLIVVGVVLGAHGSDGRVRVQPETDNPRRFRRGARLVAHDRELHIERVQRTPGGLLLVHFAEIASRSDAMALHGVTLCVPMDETSEAPPDAYYHYQLVDMGVVDEAGERLGTLTEIISTGANDVYVVTGDSAELLLPAVGDVILSVDVEANRMIVAVPEGLAWRELHPRREKPKSRRRAQRRIRPAPGG